jgi:general L-amino acid transport system substrate-binding protein
MFVLRACIAAMLVAASAAPARAGAVLDRVRTEGTIRCGAEPRPGLLGADADRRAGGLLLDLCRAIGAAVLEPPGRFEFRQYDAPAAYDAVRDGGDDVFFLTASEIIDEGLAGRILPGPTVFFQTTAVMVADSAKAQHLTDLAGQSICFSLGGNAQRHLEAWFAARHLDFVRMAYREDVELFDTYNAQVCRGLAAEVTTLAAVRLDGGANELRSRILPEPLAMFPILAATGTKDAEWAAIVAWTIHTLLRAEVPSARWAAGGLDSLPLAAPELGLAKDWQKRVVDAVGTYADVYRRNLGDGSPFKLPRGLNAPGPDGGLFVAPYSE